MIVVAILLGVILIQVVVIGILMDIIESERAENKRYYNTIRRTYDIKMEELKEDIRVRDEIISAGRYHKIIP